MSKVEDIASPPFVSRISVQSNESDISQASTVNAKDERTKCTVNKFSLIIMIMGITGVILIAMGFLRNAKDADFIGILMLVCGPLLLCCYGCNLTKTASYAYVSNVCSKDEFQKHVDALMVASPTVTFKIRCYHKGAKDSKGHINEEVTQEASKQFDIDRWVDESLPVELAVPKLDNVTMALVKFRLSIRAGDNVTKSNFEGSRELFYQQNTHDLLQDKSVEKEFEDGLWKERLTVVSKRPWWFTPKVHLAMGFLLLLPFYECMLYRRCEIARYDIRKRFFTAATSDAASTDVESLRPPVQPSDLPQQPMIS